MVSAFLFVPHQAVAQGRSIWEGLHIGGQVGWTDYDYGIAHSGAGAGLATVNDSADGVIGGVVYGTFFQFNQWVLGTDSAISFNDADTGTTTATNGLTATAEVDWSSSTRGRIGYLVRPNLLVYGAVGVAMAKVKVSGPLIVGGGDDEKLWGITYGGGIEMTSQSRFFARIEYLHNDYGDESFTQVGGGTFDVDLNSDVVRGAVGYRFDWSPLDLLTGR